MMRIVLIGGMLAVGVIFGALMSLAQLISILQPLIVAIAIMAAGLLVRLNRGMPTLDWKSLEANERKVLTQKIVDLTHEYMFVLALLGATLFAMLAVVVLEKEILANPPMVQRAVLGVTGALIAMCVIRMAYIVWRDYDIVRLQKKLIDDSADRESVEKASQEALSKVTAIRAAGLRGSSQTASPPASTTMYL